MMTARLKLKTLAAILGLATIAAFPIYQHLLREYQRKRVEAFFNPNSEGAYQARQALNAIGSGRFFGKGFLHGTQIRLRHFPALWTDFPFAVWAEEWGFVGCFVLLLAYLVLILWILKIAGEARDRFGATVCVGVAAMLFWHVDHQHRHGQRDAAGRRRDAAADQLRRLEHPDDAGRAGPGHERQRAPLLVLAPRRSTDPLTANRSGRDARFAGRGDQTGYSGFSQRVTAEVSSAARTHFAKAGAWQRAPKRSPMVSRRFGSISSSLGMISAIPALISGETWGSDFCVSR